VPRGRSETGLSGTDPIPPGISGSTGSDSLHPTVIKLIKYKGQKTGPTQGEHHGARLLGPGGHGDVELHIIYWKVDM